MGQGGTQNRVSKKDIYKKDIIGVTPILRIVVTKRKTQNSKWKIMKITNYFKMTTNKNLTLAEWLVYAYICAYSNGKVSHISRNTLMDLTGIKTADIITKHTNKLEQEGLISKEYSYSNGGKKLVTYNILNGDTNFICVSNNLLNALKTNEIAFAIRLATLRLYGSNRIILSNNEIIKRLSISKATFYRYIDALIKAEIAFKVDDGYVINPDIFFVFKQKTDKAKQLEKKLLGMANNGSVYSKIFFDVYCKNYDGINNIEKFLDWCLAGCPGLNADKQKDFDKITFDF